MFSCEEHEAEADMHVELGPERIHIIVYITPYVHPYSALYRYGITFNNPRHIRVRCAQRAWTRLRHAKRLIIYHGYIFRG